MWYMTRQLANKFLILFALLFSLEAFSQVTWDLQPPGKVSADPNNVLTKTAVAGWDNYNITNEEATTEDFVITWEITDISNNRMYFGFNEDQPFPTTSQLGIDFSVYLTLTAYTGPYYNGVATGTSVQGFDSPQVGDTFKFEVVSGVVSLYQNDILRHVFTQNTGVDNAYPQVNIYDQNASIKLIEFTPFLGGGGGPTLPTPPPANETGRLKDSDFQSEAQLLGAGATIADLLNDTKIYVTSVAKTLDDAIADGDVIQILSNAGELITRDASANAVLSPGDNGSFLMRDDNDPKKLSWFGGISIIDYDDNPIGTVIAYGSENVPPGYLLADGSCYAKEGTYTELFNVIGTSAGECDSGGGAGSGFNVPDLRNQFLRGLTGGRSVFDNQADATAINGISGSTNTTGDHTHNVLSGGGSIQRLDLGGGGFMGSSIQYGYTADNGVATQLVQNSGDHSHSVTLSGGSSETRPDNVAVVYMIKAIGRPVRNSISQRSMSPDKAGFIIWSSFDAPVEGHLKADGSCVSKTDPSTIDYFVNVGTLYGECDYQGQGAGTGVNLPDLMSQNRYIRASGGSLTVGQTQDDATAVNGLTTATGGAHNHQEGTRVQNELGDSLFGGSPTGTARGEIYDTSSANFITLTSTNGSHSHTVNSSDAETRPTTLVLVPLVRVQDRDEIKGTFEEIKSDSLSMVLASKTSPQAVGNTDTVIIYNNEIKDTRGEFNPATGVFTANSSGRFLVSATTWMAVPYSGASYMAIRRNGSIEFMGDVASNATDRLSVDVTGTIDAQAGDTIEVTLYVADATARNLEVSSGNFNRLSITQIPDTQAIVKNLNDNATHRLGDCKYSILSETDFNSIHSGSWVRLEGQSIAGSDIDTRFGINALPDAVSNGAFIRQVGGLSGELRAFQDDKTATPNSNFTGSTNVSGNHQHEETIGTINLFGTGNSGLIGTYGNSSSGARDLTAGNGNHSHTVTITGGGDNETAPKNIALNFYCLISE